MKHVLCHLAKLLHPRLDHLKVQHQPRALLTLLMLAGAVDSRPFTLLALVVLRVLRGLLILVLVLVLVAKALPLVRVQAVGEHRLHVSCRLTHQRLLVAVLRGIAAIVFGRRVIGLRLGPAWAWVASAQAALARDPG